MTVSDSPATEPVLQDDPLGLRNTLGQMFDQMETALSQLRCAIEQHGPEEVRSALGDGAAPVMAVCEALGTIVIAGNPYAVEEQLTSQP